MPILTSSQRVSGEENHAFRILTDGNISKRSARSSVAENSFAAVKCFQIDLSVIFLEDDSNTIDAFEFHWQCYEIFQRARKRVELVRDD